MIWHILPVNDIKEHVEASTCHCNPIVKVLEGGDLLVIHSSYDRREDFEGNSLCHLSEIIKKYNPK